MLQVKNFFFFFFLQFVNVGFREKKGYPSDVLPVLCTGNRTLFLPNLCH